jgi:uncharacterized protein
MANAELRVELAYSPGPGVVECWSLSLPAGSTVADALDRSGLFLAHPALDRQRLALGVWGTNVGTALRDRDRVEVCRPLKVDPKEARRRRQRRQSGAPATR